MSCDGALYTQFYYMHVLVVLFDTLIVQINVYLEHYMMDI